MVIAASVWEERAAKSAFDYTDKEWKFVVSSRRFYEHHYGELRPVSEKPIDVCRAMSAAANRLLENHIEVLGKFFDDQEFRIFCAMHSRFNTGVYGRQYHAPDPFEKAVAGWLAPRDDDMDYINPKLPKEVENAMEMLKNFDLEPLPQCILIPGTIITFCINSRNQYGGYDDVAVVVGMEPEWSESTDVAKVIDVSEYLNQQPTVAV